MWKKATEPRCAILQPKECGWFVDNSREKPILKPTFFNGDALPQSTRFCKKKRTANRAQTALLSMRTISLGMKFPMNLTLTITHPTKTSQIFLSMTNLRAILYSKFKFNCEFVYLFVAISLLCSLINILNICVIKIFDTKTA